MGMFIAFSVRGGRYGCRGLPILILLVGACGICVVTPLCFRWGAMGASPRPTRREGLWDDSRAPSERAVAKSRLAGIPVRG